MRRLAIALIPVIFLSGCAGNDPGTDLSGQSQYLEPTTTPSASLLEFVGCRQYHTYFPIRAEDAQPNIPDGFTLVVDDQGLSTLRVEATDCLTGPEGVRAASLWITLPVIPPSHLANASFGQQVAVESYIDNAAYLDQLHAWGATLAEPCACSATSPSDGGLDGFMSDGDQDDYTMQTALSPGGGSFPAEASMVYIAKDGQAIGRLVINNAESTTRGFGGVVLAYVGPGAAPPAFPGQIAHVVQDLSYSLAFETIEVA